VIETAATAPPLAENPDWFQRYYREPGVGDNPAYQVQFIKPKTGELHFATNPGPQTWSILCPFDEVLLGGRRGGGKSRVLIAAFAMGDHRLPVDDPARISFLNDKSFRGLLLREEYSSMAEFVEEAVEFYRPIGGKPIGKPISIEFPSKAKIYFNHLGDEEAFNKYRGWNITKIGVEELTQIATLRRYLKLLGSLRSVERVRNGKKYPELKTQLISTTNPDGPGALWVKDRFVYVRDKKGNLIDWNQPMRDTVTGLIRIFIPFGVESNPFLGEQTSAGRRYRSMLLAQDEVTRKQWMEGDWNAGTGRFFNEYRPDGPIGQEEHDKYPWARHKVASAPLKPWWTRWGSGDWGFSHPAAFHKFCYSQTEKRIHVYDEMSVRHVGSFEIGALLAKWWQPELIELQRHGKSPCITIHLGADAFSKTDVTKTKAEQIEAGIKEVLGPYGAILLKYNEDERAAMMRDPKRAQMMFEQRKQQLGDRICIALKPVYIDRIAAWSYMRELLRFRPAVVNLQTPADREAYLRDVLQQEGLAAYEMQAAELRKLQPEVLPKLQLWNVCKEADRWLQVAQHDTRADSDPSRVSKREDVLKMNADENGKNGDDAGESLRNGLIAFKEMQATMPLSEFVSTRVDEVQQAHLAAFGEELTDPTRLAMVAMTQQAIYAKQTPKTGGSLTFARQGSLRHRSIQ
jgi:hypothetical protein